MPIRERQEMELSPFVPFLENIRTQSPDGWITTKRGVFDKKLPSAENFDLKNMLELGVNLQQIDSKILDLSADEMGQLVDTIENYKDPEPPINTSEG